jgi:16S rRNA processing protein RimM
MGRVTLGRIAGVFGVQGWLKVRSYSDPQQNLLRYRRWFLKGPEEREVHLLQGRPHGSGLVAQLGDVNGVPIADRDVAAQFVGAEIEVPREDLPKLKRGEYYWVDLVGLQVSTTEGETLGQVERVTDNGAQAVLVLRDGERERLIPFVHGPIIRAVDMKAGRIVADWSPEW